MKWIKKLLAAKGRKRGDWYDVRGTREDCREKNGCSDLEEEEDDDEYKCMYSKNIGILSCTKSRSLPI